MKVMKVQYKFISYLTVAVVFGFLFLSFVYVGVNANDSSDLPPRPEGVPTPQPEQAPVVHPTGGFIALTMEVPSPDYWVTVQWYDGQETWYTVSGWQGNFNQDREVLWWVSPEDMGKGPFRWVVLAEVDGPPVAISDEFYLPTHTLETVRVEISADQP
jgi:hypothetical protein